VKYDAFISYSHSDDSRIAKALHDNLHRIAKRWDSLSAIRVFRDVTHLRITFLQPALVSALAESRFLVLLASPQSAASKWVREEITCFLASNPPERVLIVLIGGDLVWNESSGCFVEGPTSALPHLDALKFAKEPLFLDLRWAASEPNLSLSNPRLLDAIATLAATLQDVPKERLVGDLIEEHRRLRRNQRLNLGFRGAAGFGIAAALFFLLGGDFIFTTDAVLTPATTGYLYFAIGFPTIGAIGAACLATGWRGVAGFAIGFFILLPLYVMSSLRPFDASILDHLVLATLAVTGFVAAGALGASACRLTRWSDGMRAFGVAGVISVLLMLTFTGFRPSGIQTGLAEWPWLATRFWLLVQRAIAVAATVLEERDTRMLVPLIAAAGFGGLLFGVRLADARTMTGEPPAEVRANRFSVLLKSTNVRRALVVILILGIAVWGLSLRDSHQVTQASYALQADSLRGVLEVGEGNHDRMVLGAALPIALRTRNALDRLREHEAAEQISILIHKTIETFAQKPSWYYERSKGVGYEPPDIGDIARSLKDMGRPDELALLFAVARQHLNEAASLSAIAAARAESAFGSKEEAAVALQRVMAEIYSRDRFESPDRFERSLLAQAFFELGRVDTATDLLRSLGADIDAQGARNRVVLSSLLSQFAPESGDSLWRTGVWNELPKWREQLGYVMAVAIEGMCRRGEGEPAVSLIREHRKDPHLWHSHSRFAKAAAGMQHFDLAFAVLDALDPKEDQGWTDFHNRAKGLVEIIRAAVAHQNRSVVQKAVEQLRSIEPVVRERKELDRFAGVEITKGYALAGETVAARRVASDISDEPWQAHLEIGLALSTAGNKSEAATELATAWRGLQVSGRTADRHTYLSEIGMALAKVGQLKAARSVAKDIGNHFAPYSDRLKAISQLSIYTAILENGTVP